MSQKKSVSSQSDKDNQPSKQPYHSPKLYLLGSLDEIQANPTGQKYDGPNQLYYYS